MKPNQTTARAAVALSLVLVGSQGALAGPICNTWQPVAVPGPVTNVEALRAVSVRSMSDVWALGTTIGSPEVRRFDGATWSDVPIPQAAEFNPPAMGAYTLSSIAITPAGDVWIGGNIDHPVNSFSGYPILARYSNGGWTDHTIIPIPNHPVPPNAPVGGAIQILESAPDNTLFGLGIMDSFLGPFCAVGSEGSWTFTTLPMPFNRVQVISDVYPLSATSAWAVGYGDSGGSAFYPIAWHFDGSSWTRVATPMDNVAQTFFRGIDGTGPDDIWIVGSKINAAFQTETLVMHFNGSQWTVHDTSGLLRTQLGGVAAVAPDDVWAFNRLDALQYFHFDGVQWSNTPQPSIPGFTQRVTMAMDAAPGAGVWSVGIGYLEASGTQRSMMSERFDRCGLCPADFDGSGTPDIQDVFEYLNAWFSGLAAADFNQADGITVQDIFDFLNAWFAGC